MTRLLLLLIALAVVAGCDRTGGDHERAAAPAPAPAILWQCPMHPQIVRDAPGTCPICGMTLRPVNREDLAGTTAVPGHAPFNLSTERQQLIGVTRGRVEIRPLVRRIRAAATIANDPALYQALVEYRAAVQTRGAIGRSSIHEAHSGADALVDAAVLKLRRQGIGPRELAALENIDPSTLLLPGKTVWVYAQVFEGDASLVEPGMRMDVDIPAHPDRRYETTVLGIDPSVTPGSRTVRVRALLATPDGDLRPDSFVTATIEVPLGDRLAVPRAAVLDAGERRLVFVVSGDAHFAPREVTLGPLAGDFYAVDAGLTAGEEVVTSANFLIDSESRLQAAVGAYTAPREP